MAKKSASIKKEAPSAIPEVLDFLEIQERLDTFKKQHEAVFRELDEIANEYNQRLEAADKVCRAKNVSCGPFDLYQTHTTYDAKVLYDALGRERFLQVGGKMEMTTVYSVDKDRVEVSISKNLIPSDVTDTFRKESPRFHKPSKIEVP